MWYFDSLWSMIPANDKKGYARYMNNLEYRNNFMRLVNLAMNSFRWEGLPDTCNARYLELSFLMSGAALFCNDSQKGYMTLRGSAAGALYNEYGEVGAAYGWGFNGFNKQYKCYKPGSGANQNIEAVLGRDNVMMYPYINYITLAARRITDIIRTADVAAQKLKIPYFLTVDQSQEQNVRKILKDVNNNEQELIVSKGVTQETFKVWPTQVKGDVIKAIWEHLNNVESRIRETLGIEVNQNNDKKERLLTDEINSNNMFTELSIEHRLFWRQEFCKWVNENFDDVQISVHLNDAMEMQEEEPEEKEKEADGNEDTARTES